MKVVIPENDDALVNFIQGLVQNGQPQMDTVAAALVAAGVVSQTFADEFAAGGNLGSVALMGVSTSCINFRNAGVDKNNAAKVDYNGRDELKNDLILFARAYRDSIEATQVTEAGKEDALQTAGFTVIDTSGNAPEVPVDPEGGE